MYGGDQAKYEMALGRAHKAAYDARQLAVRLGNMQADVDLFGVEIELGKLIELAVNRKARPQIKGQLKIYEESRLRS